MSDQIMSEAQEIEDKPKPKVKKKTTSLIDWRTISKEVEAEIKRLGITKSTRGYQGQLLSIVKIHILSPLNKAIPEDQGDKDA